jgi:[ribosomal protein S5]-alanine N-acetyltransferase
MHISIKTDRLILSPVSDTFKMDIFQEFTPEITQYMPFMPNGDIQETEHFITQSNQDFRVGKSVQFCILKKETNEFLGCCGIHDFDTKAIELGIWLKKSVHRNGFAIETINALIAFIEKNFDFDYILYPVDKDNTASRKIPKKLGFIPSLTYEKKKSETQNLNIIEFRKVNTRV